MDIGHGVERKKRRIDMIQIFCVNLERAKERKELIQKEWIENLNININFWKAYDRRDIELGNFLYPYDSCKTKKYLKRDLSNGEIACLTSYITLYEFLISSKYDEVIVMEDDVSPISIENKNDFYNLIENGKEEFPGTDLMVLHKATTKAINVPNVSKKYFNQYRIIPYGNMMLYLNKNAMNKIICLLKKFIFPADHPQRILWEKKELKVIVAKQPICRHNTTDSYIGNNLRFQKDVRKFVE